MKKYLMISSVILHSIIIVALFWLAPFFSDSFEQGKEWATATDNSEVGLIEDVAIISRGDTQHKGYAINLNGERIYLTSTSQETYRVGDAVNVFIAKHPYAPLNTLMVTILGVKR